ncbi:MAG TPA: amino acid adenylation domain-containing protein [Pseudonocardiaceae bacterium]|jgi:amino acid adenylation domain-containing protein/thioester reductase-like protein
MSIDDVSTAELSGLVGDWSTPDAAATVPRLILDRIDAMPERPAVHSGDNVLRYREIGAAAALLAERLRAKGVGPGDLVPLVMNNGPELPVAILAAMSLSAVFVPMDAQWPKRRIDTLIAEIGEPVVLCSAGVARPGWVVVDVFALVAEPRARPRWPVAGPDDIVYGFYTSGSTGLPKCALNLHRGLYNRFRYMTTHFSDSSDEVILQTSRHVFDASLWQLLWPLTTGSRVVIPQRNGIFDFDAIVELIERHQVTITDFVPSVFNILVEMLIAAPASAHRLRSLRTVLIGGEEINPRAVRRFRELVPGVRIVNTYGPTEASIGSVFHEVTDADSDHVPIGHPIDNTAALILDERARPVPHGAIGELYLGGECVGAGYLHDQERTDAVFVPNPFPQVPGERLYRTGDLAMLRADGAIDYAGRRDQQVKIGGVRIELMEVEAALRAHPLVHEAKVVVHGDAVKRLAAFVTTVGQLSIEDLREHAQRTLSRDFLPARFLVVDQLPLTQTGKTDRGALLRMLDEHELEDEPAEDELDPLAAALRKLWIQLLPGASAGLSDNFFDLGGDSLSAQRLVVAVRTQLDLSISVRDVVDWPTLGELARRLSSVTPLPEDLRAIRSRIDADVDLPDDVGWRGLPARSGVREVLLTGATGFVGAQLLHDLITRTDATVHCLVRARNTQAARDRLDEAVHTYQLLDGCLPDRVIPIAGDLDVANFGMSDVDYAALAARIDTIVHSGALVNLVLSYEKHRATNVLGTVEILRLASTGLLKQLHFVSTLSLVESGNHALNLAGRLAEEPVPESTLPRNGYSQSKWVAELVLARASERGIPTAVYRLGEAMPNSATGVPNRRSLADLIVRACLRVGCTFTSSIMVDYTPVDYIGELLTAAVQRQVTGYYHVFQPDAVRFDDMLGGLRAELDLPQVSYPEFWAKVRDASAADPDDPVLAGVLALLPNAEEAHTAEARLVAMFRDPTTVFSTARTSELMLDAKVNWSELDTEILGRYSAYVTASEAART